MAVKKMERRIGWCNCLA